MSSTAPKSKSSGTQSPPLEATGEDKPMGASSVNSVGDDIQFVKDRDQRKQYFESPESAHEPDAKRESGQAKTQKMGESLADKFDKLT